MPLEKPMYHQFQGTGVSASIPMKPYASNCANASRLRKGGAKLRERVAIEHTLAHVGWWQGRRARYRGVRNNFFLDLLVSLSANLHVLARSQQLPVELQDAVYYLTDALERSFNFHTLANPLDPMEARPNRTVIAGFIFRMLETFVYECG